MNQPERELGERVGRALGGVTAIACWLASMHFFMSGQWNAGMASAFLSVASVIVKHVGARFLTPALVRRGILVPRVGANAKLDEAQRGGRIFTRSARAPWIVMLLWTIVVGAIVGASLKGAAGLPTVLAAFAFSGLGEHVVSAIRDRNGRVSRRATWEIVDGVLRVEGEKPLALARIRAAIRCDDDTPTLLLLDRHGRVALRLTGEADELDAIRDALGLERSTLPIARDVRRLAFLLIPLLSAIVVAFGAPAIARTFYGLAASILALAPLLGLRPRAAVQVGVDGVVIEGRFVPFADVAEVDARGEQLRVKEATGRETIIDLAYPGSAAEVIRRWNEHVERSETRDESEIVRRRIAIEEEGEEVPYRSRVASPDELGEALLDSAEDRDVRVRAAKRLALQSGPEAKRIREDVEEQIVDPEVRKHLDRSDG